MKILILANNDVGLYKFRKELIEELLKQHEVFISLPYGVFVDTMVEMGCIFIETSLSRHGTNPVQDLKLYLHYKKIIKATKPDIVLTYTIKPNIYGGMACKKIGVRYIPNITGLGTAVETPGLMQKITTRLYRIALKKADAVMFQNQENVDFFEKRRILFQGTKRVLLPGSGVNLKEHTYTEYPKEETNTHFLFVGRALREKGVDYYLRLAKEIRAQHPETVFHICGACDDERYLSVFREAEENGTIVYHGEQRNMTPFFASAHCVIHPTYYPEGMSNVLLEAAATGRPIITTNRSGCREIVDDGVNGYVVPTKDYDALFSATERFLALSPASRAEMGKRGTEKVEREFDRTIVIQKYMNEIEATRKK